MEVDIITLSKNELTDSLKSKFADIYLQAFNRKITCLIKPRQVAKEIIIKSLNYDMSLQAFDRDNKLVGFLGYQTSEREFISYKYYNFRKYFNPINAFLKWIILKMFMPKLAGTVIRIDSVAVEDDYRGQGIGTALIEKFLDFVKINNYKKTLLEVVDTNPRAKKLYERFGFYTKKRINYYFLARKAGFSAEDIMCKEF